VAKETKATLDVDKLDVVADRGYFNGEEILELRGSWHHGHAAKADDLELKGGWALR
jgi:hypothetical protein